jgi:DNA primase
LIDVWGTPVVSDVETIIETARTVIRSQGSYLLKDMKRTGRNIMLTCINHANGQERHPSMGIVTEDVRRGDRIIKAGTANCFTCGYTADLPEFISHLFGYNDKGFFGFKWITENFVNLSIENRKDLDIDMSRNTRSDEQRPVIDESELDQYRYTHPYMYERCLTDKVIEYFDVGYDAKTDCLTFPVHDLDGSVRFIQRRSVKGKRFQNDITKLKSEMLYGLYQVYQNLSWIKEVAVTESIIDALTFWVHRIPAVATMQAIPTPTQIKLLKNLPVRTLIDALDKDEAGQKGSSKLKEHLGNSKLIYKAVWPNQFKDVNELEQNGRFSDIVYRII